MRLLDLLNVLLPSLLAVYVELRDATPDQPSLTDAAILDLLQTESGAIVAKAQAWLDAHPSASSTRSTQP
jgi:hypothetical protein